MALVDCSECWRPVSTSAASCPGCGAPILAKPVASVGPSKPSAIVKYGGGFVLIAAALAVVSAFVVPSQSDRKKQAIACRADDGVCLLERDRSRITVACMMAVEQAVQFGYRWIDGVSTPPPIMAAIVNEKGNLLLAGDQVEAQLANGAFLRHVYYCEYEQKAQKVITVSVAPGKLR